MNVKQTYNGWLLQQEIMQISPIICQASHTYCSSQVLNLRNAVVFFVQKKFQSLKRHATGNTPLYTKRQEFGEERYDSYWTSQTFSFQDHWFTVFTVLLYLQNYFFFVDIFKNDTKTIIINMLNNRWVNIWQSKTDVLTLLKLLKYQHCFDQKKSTPRQSVTLDFE